MTYMVTYTTKENPTYNAGYVEYVTAETKLHAMNIVSDMKGAGYIVIAATHAPKERY